MPEHESFDDVVEVTNKQQRMSLSWAEELVKEEEVYQLPSTPARPYHQSTTAEKRRNDYSTDSARLDQLTMSCTKIQRTFRGRRGRQDFERIRATAAAVVIQSHFRGCKRRREMDKLRSGQMLFRSISATSGRLRRSTIFTKHARCSTSTKHFIPPDQIVTMSTTSGKFGQLMFVGKAERCLLDSNAKSLEDARQAKFCHIRVAPTDSVQMLSALPPEQREDRVANIRGLVDFIKYGWKLAMPSVIFDVVGGANEYALRPEFLEEFRVNLLNATRYTNSWIVTSGIDTGVSKVVADALSSVQSSEVVMLGICSWGACHGRSKLDSGKRFRASFKGSTIRLDGVSQDVYDHLKRHKIVLKEHLQEVFSRHGRIICTSVFREAPIDPQTGKRRVEPVVSPAEPDKLDWKHWTYITFASAASVTSAIEIRRTTIAGQTVNLNTVAVGRNGMPLGSKGPEEQTQRKAYMMHLDSINASRGSNYLPFIYDGQRDLYCESKIGSSLNPNHSHYLLVDDASEGKYGAEVAYRNDLIEFISYRRDTETCSTTEITQQIIRKSGSQVLPVITLVFGGDGGTMQKLVHSIANDNPIIVTAGSGRFADLIAEWKSIDMAIQDIPAITNGTGYSQEWSTLVERQNNLARAWLLDPVNNTGFKLGSEGGAGNTRVSKQSILSLDKQVQLLRDQLDSIVSYPQLHFFAVGRFDPDLSHRGHELRANAKLLPVVLTCTFESPSISPQIKLPLAIRYRKLDRVDQIMTRQGAKLLGPGEEMSNDSRLLTFAAFYDEAQVCQSLANRGCNVEHLDNLILLELHQLAQMQMLAKTKDYKPPLSWFNTTRRLKAYHNKNQQKTWLEMSAQEQVCRLKDEWEELSGQTQYKILAADIRLTSWDKLPWLPGWTYRAVHFLGHTKKGYSDTAREAYLGQDFILMKVERQDSGPIRVELMSRDQTILTGHHISASEAQQLVLDFVGDDVDASGEANQEWRDVFLLSSSQWVALYDPALPMNQHDWSGKPNVLLQQNMFDEVVSSLRIHDTGRWVQFEHLKQRDMSKVLIKNAFAAFKDWLDVNNVQLGVPWWETVRTGYKNGASRQRLYSQPLDPLHRLFWAIMTNRDQLAEVLWKQLPPQGSFAGAFLASYSISHGKISNQHVACGNMESWNQKTLRLLDELQLLADPECTSAIFNQYLFFGLEEEMYATAHPEQLTMYAALSEGAKIDNARRRAALQLMGCDIGTPKTRVDLAILANCQEFLGHAATEQFMDYLWVSPSYNSYFAMLTKGHWLSVLAVPRVKFAGALICWIMFAALYATVYANFEPPTQMKGIWYSSDSEEAHSIEGRGGSGSLPWETVFWLWVGALILNEVNEMASFGMVSEYLSASGNWVDAALQFVFLLALISRVASLMLWQNQDELSHDRLHRCIDTYPACHLYLICLGLLGINFVMVGIRILYSLKVFRAIGVLLVIVGDILTKDVIPFFAVLLTFLVCFEVAGIFFFLASDQHITYDGMGSYVMTWIDVGNLLDLPETLGHERWLNSAFEQEFAFTGVAHRAYTLLFFVLTGIILTNLLIAMMSDRFANVQAAATQVWRASFSLQVREYFYSTIFPIPFNPFELALNMCMQTKMERQRHRPVTEQEMRASWGKHYTWPLPSRAFDLHFLIHRTRLTSTKQSPEMQQLLAMEERLRSLESSAQRNSAALHRKTNGETRGTVLEGETGRGITVRIVNKSAVDITSIDLAKELGVQDVRSISV